MPKSAKQVVVFYQDGCPACHDYLPKFRRVAVKYRPFVAIKGVNMAKRESLAAADQYKIKAAPTTLILDAAGKVLRREEGSLDVAAIELIFAEAVRP